MGTPLHHTANCFIIVKKFVIKYHIVIQPNTWNFLHSRHTIYIWDSPIHLTHFQFCNNIPHIQFWRKKNHNVMNQFDKKVIIKKVFNRHATYKHKMVLFTVKYRSILLQAIRETVKRFQLRVVSLCRVFFFLLQGAVIVTSHMTHGLITFTRYWRH